MTLEAVERAYDFRLPPIYRAFQERGYLTYPGESYLNVFEAEWLPPSEMLDNGGFYGRPKPGLVGFAMTGGRDIWAWQTLRVSNAGEPMIAECPRDSYVGNWYAPSLLGWLYRRSLDYASAMWDEESETKQNLRNWAQVLRESGRSKWADDLDEITGRHVAKATDEVDDEPVDSSLISLEDVNNRIESAFGPGYVDAGYTWDIEGDLQ